MLLTCSPGLSGKSTLQKQFQLLHASHTLDRERPSWRPVVYLNIIRAIRMVITELDQVLSQASDSLETQPDPEVTVTNSVREEIARLVISLQPLLDAEIPLFAELNGGLAGRASSYVRTGWQSRVSNTLRPNSETFVDSSQSAATRAFNILAGTRDNIEALWRHPLVDSLPNLRKLRIEESAPL